MQKNTQEPTRMILVGSKTEKDCPKHGIFEAEVLSVFNGRPRYNLCPTCIEEREIEERRLQEEFTLELIEKSKKDGGIPQRFFKSTIKEYVSINKDAEKALKICFKYLESFNDRLSSGASLIMCGTPGTGKTHLACAILNEIANKRYSIKYTTTYKAMSAVKETFGGGIHHDVISDFVYPDLLVIDEVGVQFGSDAEKIIFYQIINGRYENVKPTILISNLNESELRIFIGERCFDRLREGGGVTIPFTWESYRK